MKLFNDDREFWDAVLTGAYCALVASGLLVVIAMAIRVMVDAK